MRTRCRIFCNFKPLFAFQGAAGERGHQPLRGANVVCRRAVRTLPPETGHRGLGPNSGSARHLQQPGQPVEISGKSGGGMFRVQQRSEIRCLIDQGRDFILRQWPDLYRVRATHCGNDLIVEPDIAGCARGGDHLEVRDRARCPHELGDCALAPDIVEHVYAVDEEHRPPACGQIGQEIDRRSRDAESV
ncbi:hypothetical protein D3C76_1278170 [compost metagenome]